MIRLACLTLLLGACNLYYGGGDDPCVQNAAPGVPPQEFRDPSNGQCEAIGYPGGCDSQCGPCPVTGIALPDWSACYGACDALPEAACLANATCHAAYIYAGNGQQTPTFWGCWELPPSGALSGGSCAGLDAQTCSEHTDCVSTYDGYLAPGTASTFDHCAPEALPPPPPACTTLTTEADCKARSDCDTIYTGTDCTCDHDGCTCQTETFASCKPL